MSAPAAAAAPPSSTRGHRACPPVPLALHPVASGGYLVRVGHARDMRRHLVAAVRALPIPQRAYLADVGGWWTMRLSGAARWHWQHDARRTKARTRGPSCSPRTIPVRNTSRNTRT